MKSRCHSPHHRRPTAVVDTVARWACLAVVYAPLPAAADAGIDFNRDIRPILAQHCWECHGPDAQARQADLRLDTADGARADRGGYAALKPQHPDDSELIARIETDDRETVMPPAAGGHPLDDQQKRLLRRWVAAGGEYQTHWSFVPPIKSELPQVSDPQWPLQPLDHFVLARLDAARLAPAAAADRYRWLRRVSLDLTGLPPTPEQAEQFATATADDAYEQVVDRLLSEDAFGEKWARTWLDLARYADTKGYEKDLPRQIWRYRDWLINALNDDLPFDQFTTEQLAGDLLPDPTEQQLIATAFHRNTMSNDEGGTDDEEFRVAAVKDRVDSTLQIWMGLTMGCAKCHSHKYDPIQQRDYYAFYALFNQTEDADRYDDEPRLAAPTPEQAARIHHRVEQIAALKKVARELNGEPADAAEDLKSALDKLEKQLKELRKQIPKTPVMRELPADRRRVTRIHIRGDFMNPGEPVAASVLSHFGELPAGAPANRLGVAKWLLSEQNPLTARVTVNRIWARLFGVGLVETEEDFGTQGLAPTHPQLLDWLAVHFRDLGWSRKQLIRTIVLSSTYRQSAVVTPEKLAVDPRNRLLSRGPRFRLSAEALRDQALAASGLLTVQVGGPSVMPPQPPGIWKTTYSTLKWQTAQGPDRYRRGLYTYWKRTSPYPSMLTFDAGSGEVCQIRRVRTNTPLQALVTLNDPAFLEAAGALARRMNGADESLEQQIAHGFKLVLTRPPTQPETACLALLYETMKSDFDQDRTAATQLRQATSSLDGDPAMIAVANVILNLDETLMKP